MNPHQPISGSELQQMKKFWQEEDERNGGRSDMTRCILEIERLRELLGTRGLAIEDVTPDFSIQYPKPHLLDCTSPDTCSC